MKIWPAYPDLCIYVPDASRAVNVVTSLVNKDQKYIGDIRKLYEKVQLDHVKTLQVRQAQGQTQTNTHTHSRTLAHTKTQ